MGARHQPGASRQPAGRGGLGEFFAQFRVADPAGFADPRVWTYGLTIAVVASIKTLLCIEAVDTLDPHKRYSPPNHELKAQGIGNILNGLVGGLPITSVIVRSSANVNAGAQTKLSCVAHGVLLLVCAAAIPGLLNKIPLAVLAAILILTGYKLANPALVRRWWGHGWQQFVPFAVTVVGVVATDLLVGVTLGLIVSVAFILRENRRKPTSSDARSTRRATSSTSTSRRRSRSSTRPPSS